MIKDRNEYDFTDKKALKRILIDGDIMPTRSQHQTVRSEDVAYLSECHLERNAMTGYSVTIPALAVPRIEYGSISTFMPLKTRGDWHSEKVLDGFRGWTLYEDRSFKGTESGSADDLSEAFQRYHDKEAEHAETISQVSATAWNAYSQTKQRLYAKMQAAEEKARETAASRMSDETKRNSDVTTQELEEYHAFEKAARDFIKDKEVDYGDPDRWNKVRAKMREMVERELLHEKRVYDERYLHEANVRKINKYRQDAISKARQEYDVGVKSAAETRDLAIKNAESARNRELGSIRRSIEGDLKSILANPVGHTSEEVSFLDSADTIGLDMRTSGAVAWDARISSTKVDDDHSAYYAVAEKPRYEKIHQGLMIWAIYSDYEHMKILRDDVPYIGYYLTRDVANSEEMDEDQKRDFAIRQKYHIYGSDGYPVMSGGYRIYSEHASGPIRVLLPVTDRIMAKRKMAVKMELSCYVVGNTESATRSIRRRYVKIVTASKVYDPSPSYHSEIDRIDDSYEKTLEGIDKQQAEAVKARTETYDAAIEDLETQYDDDISAIDKAYEDKVASERKKASDTIKSILMKLNEAMRDPETEDRSKVYTAAMKEIDAAKKAMSDAKSKADRDRFDATYERNSKLQDDKNELYEDYRDDIMRINREYGQVKQDAGTEHFRQTEDVRARYGKRIRDRFDAMDKAIVKIWDDAHRKVDGLSPDMDPVVANKVAHRIYVAAAKAADAATQAAYRAISRMEHPVAERLCAEANIPADVDGFGVGPERPWNSFYISVGVLGILIKPELKTLTGADFRRFDEYYEEKDEEE